MGGRPGLNKDNPCLEATLRVPHSSRILIVPSILTIYSFPSSNIEYSIQDKRDAFLSMQSALSDPDQGVPGLAENRSAKGRLLACPQRREKSEGKLEERHDKVEAKTQQATDRILVFCW